MRPPAQRSLLAGAAAVARNNLGAIIGCLVLFMIFGPSLRGAPSTASNYKAFTPRSLPPPGPREPSPFRAPLCAAPAWPGSALVEDMDHCPPPGTVYGNYQADELIKVRGGEGMERAAAARFRIPRPALPPPSILTFPPSFALSLSLLQLDINSHIPPPQGGWSAARPPPVASAATCAQACAAEARCNVWTFCADHRFGCGECFPQAAGHAAPGPAMAKFGVNGGCTPDGSYPFGTCSLKRAADPARPRPADDADFDSWISGVKGGKAAPVVTTPDEEGFVETKQMADTAAGRAGARRAGGGGGGGGGGGVAQAAAWTHDGGP